MEDGDPSGYQSNKGKEGKKNARISSLQLPPRTPQWQPLDFSIWNEIEGRALKNVEKHTKKSYLKRLRRIASGLPVKYVKDCCEAMHGRILSTKQAKGKHEKGD